MTSIPAPDHPTAPSPRVLSARGPEDLLAAVPVVLGFEPHDSLVLMTFGGSHPFHARVDLPGDPEDVEAVAQVLLEPALRHAVQGVALVVYAATDDPAGALAAVLVPARFETAGVPVRVVVRADGRRWWLPQDGPGAACPYDPAAHPFRAQSVLDGQVTHSSRADLAATLATDTVAAARVGDLLAAASPPDLDAVDVAVLAAHHVQQGSRLSEEELAALAVGIELPAVRDGAWTLMTRATARAHVALWSDAVRRTPPDLLGGPASVLAFAAWLVGDGALAWCAIDRARQADPGNTLATLVADLLVAAVPPATWAHLRDADEHGEQCGRDRDGGHGGHDEDDPEGVL